MLQSNFMSDDLRKLNLQNECIIFFHCLIDTFCAHFERQFTRKYNQGIGR